MYKHRAGSASVSTLPAIPEDHPSHDVPPVPARAVNRPKHPQYFGIPPPAFNPSPPPAYEYKQHIPDSDGPIDEKLEALRNKRQVARRGGWKRLALIALLLVLFIVGLGVGLGVGLTQKHKSTAAGGTSGFNGGDQNPATSTTFPAGSYSIETYLDTASTNCTANAATWLCYPYTTYAQSQANSEATFNWIINPVAGSKTQNYTISSTENMFSIFFSNATLMLQDGGQAFEHYFFEITMQKPVIPRVALTSSNVAATCYFNQTTFQGFLYTKMARTYPSNSTDGSSTTTEAFGAWPYAVRVEQIAASGSGTPICLDSAGNSVGDFSVATDGESCNCLYLT